MYTKTKKYIYMDSIFKILTDNGIDEFILRSPINIGQRYQIDNTEWRHGGCKKTTHRRKE